MRVPRCRTMMPPARIASPPYTLTPSRLACESRPLRELPPAFLCAMIAFLAGDAVDQELGVALAVALVLLVMLAPPHLEDLHFLSAAVRDDRRLDCRAGDGGLTKPHAVAVAD